MCFFRVISYLLCPFCVTKNGTYVHALTLQKLQIFVKVYVAPTPIVEYMSKCPTCVGV
jgi:hypothetical protein